ncbi:CPBP family intramembrane glutamic endopeptidase [Dysgonomonas capnocytophagoides]|uniref:CPBP family intramembrane glutamic endopeptidase n=1 Tax=Dysgonomonas capnocytophagoides TaxID=45254 RepID=UPI0030C87F11
MNKEIFLRMSSWSQLFFLLLFSFTGLLLSIVFISILAPVMGGIDSLNFIRVMQVFQSVFIFLVPALLCAYLFNEDGWQYLKIKKAVNLKVLIYSIILIVAIQPLISFTGYYNKMMTLPESLSELEQSMQAMENSAAALLERLMADHSPDVVIANFIVIAVAAGITEEFFFRGSLQQLVKKICHNRHVTVWITAFIFSFIHFQFYGFVPRMLLGALLGYIFLWSGNLWIPVIVHILNNALSVALYYKFHSTPVYDRLESFGTGDTVWATVASIAVTGVILSLLSREYQRNNPEEFTI